MWNRFSFHCLCCVLSFSHHNSTLPWNHHSLAPSPHSLAPSPPPLKVQSRHETILFTNDFIRSQDHSASTIERPVTLEVLFTLSPLRTLTFHGHDLSESTPPNDGTNWVWNYNCTLVFIIILYLNIHHLITKQLFIIILVPEGNVFLIAMSFLKFCIIQGFGILFYLIQNITEACHVLTNGVKLTVK